MTLRPRDGGPVPAASFAMLLRAHREQAMQSQNALAKRARLSPRTIRDLEAGRVQRPQGASGRLLSQTLGLQGSLRHIFTAAATGQSPAPASTAAQPQDRRTTDAESVGGDEGGVFQLPLTITDFTGRSDPLDRLCDWLDTSKAGGSPYAVAAVTGKTGIGTTLAACAARRLRPVLPDGQLCVQLGGAHAHPLEPDEMLGRFLHGLGAGPGTNRLPPGAGRPGRFPPSGCWCAQPSSGPPPRPDRSLALRLTAHYSVDPSVPGFGSRCSTLPCPGHCLHRMQRWAIEWPALAA